ncbi:hypothetical protein TSTA_125970 [Talaromyces stipitatus ATCC 10500]|uniref:Uncharacterized protein n=1 Tax=Talaromyces stipitatus (strain ATCC 10500 / CBS 375.48 / QM 6759 / NRRL 1006) TaxID=441959 RepID=B8MB96_TALSN|nr:uncharacterized protein TSTA_125970 [Talaromyces stipitatus ATCC 10500]EED18885.1 hypothetical protein TSTA_125970 [Talaromyces stipitatus ATCC 10500]
MSVTEASVAAPVVASSENNIRGHMRSRGRGRGGFGRGSNRGRGRGHGRGQGRDGTNEAFQPTAPEDAEIQAPVQSITQQGQRNQIQQPRQNRHREQTQSSAEGTSDGPRRRNKKPANTQSRKRLPTQIGGRSFGGRLTRGNGDSTMNLSPDSISRSNTGGQHGDHLHADVPEFVPGQLGHDARSGPQPVKQAHNHPPKVTTKSAAPDIATRTHEDIANGLGQRTKVRRSSSVKTRTARMYNECGAALDVISLTMFCQQHIRVGVRKKLIPDLYQEFLLTLVDKPVLEVENDALTLAIQPAMRVLVHRVLLWDRHKTVSAERTQRQSDVLKQITLTVGVVARFVVTCFLVVNTLVPDLVTRVFADLAKRKSTLVAIVEKSRIRSYAAPPKRK